VGAKSPTFTPTNYLNQLQKRHIYNDNMPRPRKESEPTIEPILLEVNKNLTQLRKERGLTQLQLAEIIGISRNLLANYELGRTHLTDETIILIAKALNVSTDRLLGIETKKKKQTNIQSIRLVKRMQRIEKLPTIEQRAILKTIDTLLKGTEAEG
jgi:transcriptional regulator with XRE-family HTH domain